MESSACGKVLIIGGFLILYPKYYGIVIRCSAKITCELSELDTLESAIYVVSNRFSINAKYFTVPFSCTSDSNIFITQAIENSLYFISLYKTLKCIDLKIEIHADEEFYLYGKTGLGSSAALTVSLVKSLFSYYELNNPQLIHFVSQLSHFKAQKKIGSGFDVSASIFGSQLFRRYKSELMLSLFESLNCSLEQLNQEIYQWPIPQQFSLPQDLHIVMACTRNNGSDTRVLVKQVTEWLENSENFKFFDRIQMIIDEFIEKISKSDYKALKKLSSALKNVLWEMSEASGVNILPRETKEILERVESSLSNIVFSSVPGAGGNDAFYFIVNCVDWCTASTLISEFDPSLEILNVRALDFIS